MSASSPSLILASSSPYRQALLRQLRLPFGVIAPNIDETPANGETAEQLVRRLAVGKAQAVAAQIGAGLVIGADQVAVHGRHIVGKPADRRDAENQLRQASGQTVHLYTGLALVNAATGKTRVDVAPFRVRFRDLDDDTIHRYLSREDVSGCCGSLRAEGLGIALLQALEGDDPSALIGLPLIRLVDMLAAEGVATV